jgi:6,7-dimethyl-8-ribityllumazine synthase
VSDVFKEETGDWPYREGESAFSRLPAAQQSADGEPTVPESEVQAATPDEGSSPPTTGAGVLEREEAAPASAPEAPAPDAELVKAPESTATGGTAAVPAEDVEGEQATGEAEAEIAVEPAEAVDHATGGLDFPAGAAVVQGEATGERRTVGVVVSRFNGEITNRLLGRAMDELEAAGVAAGAITIVPVPGAFELPLAAMALAKTRKFSCVIALGCVIRGETPHFDFVAGEAASGLQLAALETGVPVSFGLLTCETKEQAEARLEKGAEAARAALEMADLFSQVRMQAAGR